MNGSIAVRQIVSHHGDLFAVDGAGRLWRGAPGNSADDFRWTQIPLPDADSLASMGIR
jgi:hypothetical protein